MSDIPHGTENGYVNYRCRCDECRKAHAIAHRQQIRGTCPVCGGVLSNRYVNKMCRPCFDAKIAAARKHGTETMYKRCHCDLCKAAVAAARKRRRWANIEATRAYDRARVR